MTAWLLGASWLLATAGTVLGGLVLALTRRIKPALSVLLDFLLAAGPLRLSLAATWTAIASAGADGRDAVRALVTKQSIRPKGCPVCSTRSVTRPVNDGGPAGHSALR